MQNYSQIQALNRDKMVFCILGNSVNNFDISFSTETFFFYFEMLKIPSLKLYLNFKLSSHFCCNAFRKSSFMCLAFPCCPVTLWHMGSTGLRSCCPLKCCPWRGSNPRLYPVPEMEEVGVLTRWTLVLFVTLNTPCLRVQTKTF